MKEYLDMLRHIKEHGRVKSDRTGTGTTSVFGYQIRFDLTKGFPLVTTKKLYLRSIIHELLWFIKGSTNNEDLKAVGVSIWDEWAKEEATYKELPKTREELIASLAEWRGIPLESAELELNDTTDVEKLFDKYNRMFEIGTVIAYLETPLSTTKRVIDKPVGDLGKIYGYQWRSWTGPDGRVYDQIKMAIDQLRTNPDSRRNIVSAWNVADLEDMALMPCHTLFQFYADELTLNERITLVNDDYYDNEDRNGWGGAFHFFIDGDLDGIEKHDDHEAQTQWMNEHNVPKYRLSCQLYQRSADCFLGVPFNIASYALLTHMVAQVANMAVGEFVHTFGDLHIYSNHMEQVDLQLSREPKALPKLVLNPEIKEIDDFTFDDIKIVNYQCHPAIKAPVAV